ncbi:C40 family peptidase, partial [Nocardia neocaledoniensis]|uniref:C40 family peptidase n=1 Tax=Nocardia neocaledoniensis TaxID=236511 RepID=UPI0011BF60D7
AQGAGTPDTTGKPAGSASPTIEKAIADALAQTGKPYVWGGTGPNGFDCSGLMQHAAAAAGKKIPRVSQDQYRQLPKVDPKNIKRGDLIFPEDAFPPNSDAPTHVMMYLGDGTCIAASTQGVPIGKVDLPKSFRATRWAD